jgi:nitrate/TMAO reductase-like tetraheme cytochrome c subunit
MKFNFNKKTIIALIGGAVIGLGISYIAAVAVDITGQPKFCISCHSMEPMVESFHYSVHGGNNPQGFAAHHCTDCHLPHKSLIGYLFAKGMSGLRDGLAEAGFIKKVDFGENFWEMKHYVYDSACLKCHHGIQEPEKAIGMAENIKEIHTKFYWEAKKEGKDISCVSCHNDYTMTHFAHPNLLEALEEEK